MKNQLFLRIAAWFLSTCFGISLLLIALLFWYGLDQPKYQDGWSAIAGWIVYWISLDAVPWIRKQVLGDD